MNKKIFLILLCVFLSGCFAHEVLASENFYVLLNIKETKSGQDILFSLQYSELGYGDYERFVDVYDKDFPVGDYILEVYDPNKRLLKKYSLWSSRFVYYDTGAGVEAEERDSAAIGAFIPYDDNNPPAFIRIDNNGVKTGFKELLIISSQEGKGLLICVKENEDVDIAVGKQCCSGLTPAFQSDDYYICVSCGDGACSKFENYNSCPSDCSEGAPISALSRFVKLFTVKNILIFVLIILILLFISLMGLRMAAEAKKRKIEKNFNLLRSRNNPKKDDLSDFNP